MLLKTFDDEIHFFNNVDIIYDVDNKLEHNLTRVLVCDILNLIKPGVLVKQLRQGRLGSYAPMLSSKMKPAMGIVLWITYATYGRPGQIGILWNSNF